MLRNISFICGMVVLLLFMSCSSPQKSFDKGDYEKAFSTALKNIQKGKNNRKDKQYLDRSFGEILKQRQASFAQLHDSSFIEDWEAAHQEYEDLLSMYDEGRFYLGEYSIQMETVAADQQRLEDEIGLNYFDMGETAFESYEEDNDKLHAQEAFLFYTKAREYGHVNADLPAKMQQAEEGGIIKVLVSADQRWGYSGWDIDREFDDIERESGGFVEVFYKRNQLEADCHLEVLIDEMDRNVRQSSSRERFSERIQTGTETQRDTSGNSTTVPVYETVTADVDVIREEVEYRLDARVRVDGDRRYCDYRDRTLYSDDRITIESYNIQGDRRAVPDAYLRAQNNNERIDEGEVYEELVEDIFDDFRRTYFR